jgi:hypothetical protein
MEIEPCVLNSDSHRSLKIVSGNDAQRISQQEDHLEEGSDQSRSACLLLYAGFILAYSSALKMDATYSSEMQVGFHHQTTWQYIQQNKNLLVSIAVFLTP